MWERAMPAIRTAPGRFAKMTAWISSIRSPVKVSEVIPLPDMITIAGMARSHMARSHKVSDLLSF